MIATGEKMGITQIEGSFPQNPFPTAEEREAFVKEWAGPPDEKFKQYFLNWEKRDQITNQMACEIAEWNEMMHYIDDATRSCAHSCHPSGANSAARSPIIFTMTRISSLRPTGIELDEEGPLGDWTEEPEPRQGSQREKRHEEKGRKTAGRPLGSVRKSRNQNRNC